MKKMIIKDFAFLCAATAMFVACGDDTTSDPMAEWDTPKSTELPESVASVSDLQMNYVCNAANKCKGVMTGDMGLAVCDGNGGWAFMSLIDNLGCPTDEPPVSSEAFVESSASVPMSSEALPASSSSVVELSSETVVESSSSVEPLSSETVPESSSEAVDQCEAMDKTDVSTWHFVRKDDFGDDVEYTYSVSGRDLILTTSGVNGNSTKTLSMYNMESEVYVEMAFSAARATCRGN